MHWVVTCHWVWDPLMHESLNRLLIGCQPWVTNGKSAAFIFSHFVAVCNAFFDFSPTLPTVLCANSLGSAQWAHLNPGKGAWPPLGPIAQAVQHHVPIMGMVHARESMNDAQNLNLLYRHNQFNCIRHYSFWKNMHARRIWLFELKFFIFISHSKRPFNGNVIP